MTQKPTSQWSALNIGFTNSGTGRNEKAREIFKNEAGTLIYQDSSYSKL